jgi:hypothetical protein
MHVFFLARSILAHAGVESENAKAKLAVLKFIRPLKIEQITVC